MKFALWFTAIFALSVLLGLVASLNNGYAILLLPPYRLEVSFNFLIILIIIFTAIVHWALRMINLAAHLPRQVKQFQREKKHKAAQQALQEAGIAYFEGRFRKAERKANQSMGNTDSLENQVLAMLIAANAANISGNFKKRDRYLNQIENFPEHLQLAKHIVDAQLRLNAKDTMGALNAIECARNLSPNLTHALRLELKIRLIQKHPEAILALTEKLLKSDALTPERAKHYRLDAYQQQLTGLISPKEIRDWLRRIPDTERNSPYLINQVVARLITLEDYDYAATLLAEGLAHDNHDTPELSQELGKLAAYLSAEKRLYLLKIAENWLKKRPRDHALLLALGRLAFNQQLWGKAQNYLEASLSIHPTLSAHAELARLFEIVGKTELAAGHYKKSLQLALQQEG